MNNVEIFDVYGRMQNVGANLCVCPKAEFDEAKGQFVSVNY